MGSAMAFRIMRCISGLRAAGAEARLASPVILVVAAAMLGGCASAEWADLNKDSPAAVKQAAAGKRAGERWQALIRGDYEAAYAYFTPASREVIRAADFAERMAKFPYRAVKVDKVECDGEVCTVNLTLTYDFPAMKMTNVSTPVQESWLIERGKAWFVYRG